MAKKKATKKIVTKKKPKRDPANIDGVELTYAPIEFLPGGEQAMREFLIEAIAQAMYRKYSLKTDIQPETAAGQTKENDTEEEKAKS